MNLKKVEQNREPRYRWRRNTVSQLSFGELPTELVQCHASRRRRIVAEWHSIDRNLDGGVQQRQDVVGNSESFVPDDEYGFAYEREVVNVLRVGCLFQSDEGVALFL